MYWWELMEMLRKFILVGLFVTIEPGTILQISSGTIFCATYLMVQLVADPYEHRSDTHLAVSSSFSLLIVLSARLERCTRTALPTAVVALTHRP